MPEKIADIPIFFIIGRERSGTSLLRSLFDAHEHISIPLECRFIVNLYNKYHKKTYWDKKLLMNFFNDLIDQPAFRLFSIDYEELKNNILSMEGNNNYASVCKVVYYSYKSWNQKKDILLLGDKNPSYSLHLKMLIHLFPEAKFIHIIRDYRDNIFSMCKVNFESHIVSSLAYRWKYYNRLIDKTKAKTPDIFYTLKYEDLVEDPAFFMSRICDFLNVDYKPEMLDFYKSREKIMAIYPEKIVTTYQKSLFNPINKSSVNAWRKKLPERKVRIAEYICGDYGKKYNYQKEYKKTDLFIKLLAFPGIIYGHIYFYWIAFLNRLPYSIKIRIFHTLANIFNHYWKNHTRVGTNFNNNKE